MPALDRNEQVKFGDCGNMYTRQNTARHRKNCSKGVISCPDCKYFTYNQQEMSYHMAKKHAQPNSKQSTVFPSCEQELSSYYSLQQHRRKEHGAKQRKPSDTVADLNKIVEDEGEDGEKLKEELGACQHFLVDTKWRNKELCWGVLTNLGVGYGIKRVFEILSYDFINNFKFSKTNKISFIVKCNSAVSL